MPPAEFYNPERKRSSGRTALMVGIFGVALAVAMAVPTLEQAKGRADFGYGQLQGQLSSIERTATNFSQISYRSGRLAINGMETNNCGEKSWVEVMTLLRDCEVNANGVYNVVNLPSFLREVDMAFAATGTGLVGKLTDTLPPDAYQPLKVQYVTGYESDVQNRTRSIWRGEVNCGTGTPTGEAVCKLSLAWDFDYTAPPDAETESEYR